MTKQLTRLFLLIYIISIICGCAQKKNQPLFRIPVGENFGFIDSSGKIIIEPSFSFVGDFNDGLAISLLENNKYGFIDEKGKYVIAPNLGPTNGYPLYLYLSMDENVTGVQKAQRLMNELSFSDGLALYFDPESKKYGYMNVEGKIVIEPKFLGASKFKNGFAKVMTSDDTTNWENKHVGLINKKGEFVIPDKYFNISHIAGNFLTATLCTKNSKGYNYTSFVLNKSGRLINTVKVEGFFYQDFSNGYARGDELVSKTYKQPSYFIYDSTGNFLKSNDGLPLFFEDIIINKGRYIWVKKDKIYRWFILENNEFKFIDNKEYEDTKGFNRDGIASVKYKNPENGLTLYGYIDTVGKFVLEPKFNKATNFKNGLAYATLEDNSLTIGGYINMKGEFVWNRPINNTNGD